MGSGSSFSVVKTLCLYNVGQRFDSPNERLDVLQPAVHALDHVALSQANGQLMVDVSQRLVAVSYVPTEIMQPLLDAVKSIY